VTAALLGLSYSQTGIGATLDSYVSAPTKLVQPDPAGQHEIRAALNDGIQIDFAHASGQAGEGWARYGSNLSSTVTGNSKTLGALGEYMLSGSGRKSDPTTAVRANYSGPGSPDADVLPGSAAVNGLNPANTPEPGTLLRAGSALIAIGATLKRARKKVLESRNSPQNPF
jgi:hypothetical protein